MSLRNQPPTHKMECRPRLEALPIKCHDRQYSFEQGSSDNLISWGWGWQISNNEWNKKLPSAVVVNDHNYVYIPVPSYKHLTPTLFWGKSTIGSLPDPLSSCEGLASETIVTRQWHLFKDKCWSLVDLYLGVFDWKVQRFCWPKGTSL